MKNKRVILLWILTLAWTWVMFALSGQSAGQSSRLSGGLTQWMLDLLSLPQACYGELEHVLRKLAHFCMFALEGILMYASMKNSLKRHAVKTSMAVCAAVAALNEYYQTFFEGRSCELRDVVIDAAGAFAGIAFAGICYYLMKSRRRA